MTAATPGRPNAGGEKPDLSTSLDAASRPDAGADLPPGGRPNGGYVPDDLDRAYRDAVSLRDGEAGSASGPRAAVRANVLAVAREMAARAAAARGVESSVADVALPARAIEPVSSPASIRVPVSVREAPSPVMSTIGMLDAGRPPAANRSAWRLRAGAAFCIAVLAGVAGWRLDAGRRDEARGAMVASADVAAPSPARVDPVVPQAAAPEPAAPPALAAAPAAEPAALAESVDAERARAEESAPAVRRRHESAKKREAAPDEGRVVVAQAKTSNRQPLDRDASGTRMPRDQDAASASSPSRTADGRGGDVVAQADQAPAPAMASRLYRGAPPSDGDAPIPPQAEAKSRATPSDRRIVAQSDAVPAPAPWSNEGMASPSRAAAPPSPAPVAAASPPPAPMAAAPARPADGARVGNPFGALADARSSNAGAAAKPVPAAPLAKLSGPAASDASRVEASALHRAADAGDVAALSRLLASPGLAVDAPDAHGRTALLRAVLARQVDAARVLLAAGADPSRPDAAGLTALAAARASGDPALQALLQSGHR